MQGSYWEMPKEKRAIRSPYATSDFIVSLPSLRRQCYESPQKRQRGTSKQDKSGLILRNLSSPQPSSVSNDVDTSDGFAVNRIIKKITLNSNSTNSQNSQQTNISSKNKRSDSVSVNRKEKELQNSNLNEIDPPAKTSQSNGTSTPNKSKRNSKSMAFKKPAKTVQYKADPNAANTDLINLNSISNEQPTQAKRRLEEEVVPKW